MVDTDIHTSRVPEKIEMLEVEQVVELSLEQLFVTKALVISSTGVFAESFSLRNINVTGVDINLVMPAVASQPVSGVNSKETLAAKLPFDNKSFDIVFMGFVFHEYCDPNEILKEVYRVATSRVMILELPYLDEKIGLPIGAQFKPENILKMAKAAKFKNCGKISMPNFILYKLNF